MTTTAPPRDPAVWWQYLLGRRRLLAASGAALAGTTLSPLAQAGLRSPAAAAAGSTPPMVWLGRSWWSVRPGDWLAVDGRIEQHAPARRRTGRVVNRLTEDLTGGRATVSVVTGTLQRGRGFSGLLLGTGTRGLDPRARALVGPASGTGGGLFATYEADGRVRLRDHRREATDRRRGRGAVDPLSYPVLATGTAGRSRRTGERVRLQVQVLPTGARRVRLVITARDAAGGRVLSRLTTTVPRGAVRGGLGLVSSELDGSGARHWFSDFTARGRGVARHPDRGVGPIVSTLFTRTSGRLRLTAQLTPVDPDHAGPVRLERRALGGWLPVATSPVEPGFCARFDVVWPSASATDFRVVATGYEGTPGASYEGTVPAEPRGSLRLGSISCARATFRLVDLATRGILGVRPRLPGERRIGLYSPQNLWFPFAGTVAGLAVQRPDLLVAHGDQFYEDTPAGAEPEDADLLDVMGRYLLWCQAFGELTRRIPTVVLVDDHDVYQPNLWGAGGVRAPRGPASGGFTRSIDWVNALTQMQCGHNPPPADDTPVGDGVRPYYASFTYGGVDLAIVEDRTFKSAPSDPRPDTQLDMLGAAQERFLAQWVSGSSRPKVMLSQTVYACVQTGVDGRPDPDKDSGGWPRPARDRAIDVLAGHGVLMVAGDQHMGSLVQHLHPDGGPWQFASPAVGAGFQRWFEPGGRRRLPDRWTDAFGNAVRVAAIVQPSTTRSAYERAYGGTGVYGQRGRLNEGYGIVDVDVSGRQATVAAWPDDVDPTRAGASPYPGFPATVSLR
ncbi:hypothetical protein KLP28_04470 [Nocardioidaceae bacterium]|nr:hypothetical protein KLP28_04470 [Nocardioidaceae bacterium]